MKYASSKKQLETLGYTLIKSLYSDLEITEIKKRLQNAEISSDLEQKNKHVFAIRQLFKVIPDLLKVVCNQNLKDLVSRISSAEYFLTKALYFDKPSTSNWFVSYHQDLSISVNRKVDLKNYKNWTFKKGQYGVQPPVEILEDTLTLRIHLDDTNEHNGALKVIPKSHLNGITPIHSKAFDTTEEQVCNAKTGDIMLMKPLIFHASNRTTNNKRRRVIHLEFNKHQLQAPLHWLEYQKL